MPTLASELRNKLERVVAEAREKAEVGARAALESLAVHHHEPYGHMTPEQRELRNHLRARARQLGDRQDSSGRLAIDHLAGECAYEHWHRMLFARFLAENDLLIEPEDGIAISLAEAEELAADAGVDMWVYASRCAERMLPQIFRPDDPLLQIAFATEHMLELERLLDSLEPAVFTASDALGWVYQFWQSKRKDEVNRSEVKIGADEISAVTQLFTEPYMVEFLLHNTLGAWWAGRKLSPKDAAAAKTEDELRAKLALPGVGWEYLRFVRGADGASGPWRPAAGTFDGWPKAA
ncbi:MAG: SAM-dependent DNA methyltransferase, partial [Planctomycetota bacterium]